MTTEIAGAVVSHTTQRTAGRCSCAWSSALEEQIAHRREYYNAAVNLNNVRTEQFPDMLLATTAGLRRAPLFAATAEEMADIDVGGRPRV